MYKFAGLLLALPLVACNVGSVDGPGSPGDQPDAGATDDIDAPVPPGEMQVSGTISASATWSGTIDVVGNTTIASGVTVTVMAGSVVRIADSGSFLVRGVLDLQGTAAAKITVKPSGNFHGGFYADGGGQLKLAYVVLTGGGVHTGTGGTATVTDTKMSHVGGDLLTMEGGTIDVQYSQIGLDPGGTDTTHCEMHFDGNDTISVTHTNIGTGVYGVMFYGGTHAVFTNDNWYSNGEYSVHTVSPTGGQQGVSGDFTGSWFDKNDVLKAAGTNLTGIVVNPQAPRNTAGPRG